MNKLNKTENFNISEGNIKEDNISLTEKLKTGELKTGFYYVYLKHLKMFDIAGSSTLSGILERGNENSVEVLAKVPSYQEYLESESHCAVYSEVNKSLKEENQQIKELLRECGNQLYEYADVCLQEGYEIEREEVLKLKNKIDEALE